MLEWSKKSSEMETSKFLSPGDDQGMYKCIEALLIILCSVRNMPIPVFLYSWNIHMNYIRSDACLLEILMPDIQYEEIDLN